MPYGHEIGDLVKFETSFGKQWTGRILDYIDDYFVIKDTRSRVHRIYKTKVFSYKRN
jgi:hypothetical protein